MERNLFYRYAPLIEQHGGSAQGRVDMEVGREPKHTLQYIPFEHVNSEARLVIVGITPGPSQIALAYTTAQSLLKSHRPIDEIMLEIKKIGAFGGASMRPNLVKILRHFRFDELLEIDDVESLWSENSSLLHSTSVVPHAAFRISHGKEKMFAGSFDEVMRSSLLRECFMDCFVPSLMEIQSEAHYVGLGACPQAALRWCVKKDLLREEQVLGAFCHPSSSGGSTIKYYLREATRSDLKSNDPVLKRTGWLDDAYHEMYEKTSSLLGVKHPHELASHVQKSLHANSEYTQGDEFRNTSDIEYLQKKLQDMGLHLHHKTKKLTEFQSLDGKFFYLLNLRSTPNKIVIMVHPECNPDHLRNLHGVTHVSTQHSFFANMPKFPKRRNKGATETTYGWQVHVNSLSDMPRFLEAFSSLE